MARPSPAYQSPAPRRGAYAALIGGLRRRFPGDVNLHRDLLSAGTLDEVLAALARSTAASAAVLRHDPAARPGCAARAAALQEVLAFFGRTRGGDGEAGVGRAGRGALRVRAGGVDYVCPLGSSG